MCFPPPLGLEHVCEHGVKLLASQVTPCSNLLKGCLSLVCTGLWSHSHTPTSVFFLCTFHSDMNRLLPEQVPHQLQRTLCPPRNDCLELVSQNLFLSFSLMLFES